MRAFVDSSLDNFAVHSWFSGTIQSMAPPCSTHLCEGRNRNGRQSCGCWPMLPLPRLALGLVAQRAWTATSWGVRCDIGLGQEMSRDVKSDFQSNLCHYVLNSSKFEGLNLNIQSAKSSLVKACPARNIPFTVWAKKFADRAAHTQPDVRGDRPQRTASEGKRLWGARTPWTWVNPHWNLAAQDVSGYFQCDVHVKHCAFQCGACWVDAHVSAQILADKRICLHFSEH